MTKLFRVIVSKGKAKIRFKIKVWKTKIYFKTKLFHLGKNSILESKLTLSNNLQNIFVGDNVRIRYGWRLETFDQKKSVIPIIRIGSGTQVERFLHIGATQGVEIGENVLIASNVFISDHDHKFTDITSPILCQGIVSKGRVQIKDNCWIGNNVSILSGVTIGKNSVIGANSVVTKDVPDNSIAVGIPARVLKEITKQ